ncbi:efflux RND transporter periplasmic adaptor subunit [Pararhizobium antarcticum]|uniref:Efflux transporter periplasmic adaptor subunit n=1 Tax=Pararhizobium antarcticum TaxID=1798805 RepID=A0A657LW32_9HYPH|nr:efflux RND transporter periplasmic adaptor subunit [Pararhizobium antarcticum]OJF89777.1 efflux transporter periplasmic adaptor subunit [Rhizobium sp. 58]OJF99726.1 efflux transporter periplasmic adaptor subunit [Pararhizobium antarcticum]
MTTGPQLIALLAVATLLSACQKEDEAKVEPPRPVLSLIAQLAPETVLALPGTVEARVKSQFGFRILGRIIARDVQVGDLVKKGDILAAIDPLALELAVKSAQSDLVTSQAQLSNARTNEDRQKTLFERQSGAKATFEIAQQERKTAEAAEAKAKANLDKLNEQLSYALLLAEFDGVVTAVSAEVGQVVSAGQSVVTVARPDERDAVIDVPEAVGPLKPGAVFDVSLQLAPDIRARGLVREIAPEADEATRTRRTRLTLVDPPEALRLGAVITVSALAKGMPSIRLPSSAIRTEGTKTSVWVVDEKTGKVTAVTVSLSQQASADDTVTVTDGIKSGDRIVTAGVNTLEDGQAVRIVQETVN